MSTVNEQIKEYVNGYELISDEGDYTPNDTEKYMLIEAINGFLENDNFDDIVTITRKEYEQFIEDSKILNALYAGGVDNWEGYEESLSEFEDE